MKTLILPALLLCAVVSSAGQGDGAKKRPSVAAGAKLLTEADVNAVLTRVYGYDPAIQWKVFSIRKATVPGMTEVLLKVRNDIQHLFISADGHYAINGDMMPFGPDLYAIPRKQLRTAGGPVRGPDKPAVMMVEFSDLQCPHCKEAQPIVEKLAADFPQMRIVFAQYPLPGHASARKAAQYADCAGRTNNEAAWKYIAAIYENQSAIALAVADEKLKELATSAGLDAEKLSACAAAPGTEARVKKSVDLGDALGVIGTPAIFVNGRLLERVVGAPYEEVKAIVKYEIDLAGK